jgi:hypothetical protein
MTSDSNYRFFDFKNFKNQYPWLSTKSNTHPTHINTKYLHQKAHTHTHTAKVVAKCQSIYPSGTPTSPCFHCHTIPHTFVACKPLEHTRECRFAVVSCKPLTLLVKKFKLHLWIIIIF